MNAVTEARSQAPVTVSAPQPMARWLEKIVDRPLTMAGLPVPQDLAEATLAQIRRDLEPAGPKAVAVLLVDGLACYRPPENVDELMRVHVRDMAKVPVPFVEQAIKRHQQASPWFPKPSELWNHVADEVCRLRLAEWKLTEMLGARS